METLTDINKNKGITLRNNTNKSIRGFSECTRGFSTTIVSYRIVSYRIVSYRIVSYRIVSYRIVSYRIVSYPILSYPILSYPIVSYRIVSYRILSYPIYLSIYLYIYTRSSAVAERPRDALCH